MSNIGRMKAGKIQGSDAVDAIHNRKIIKTGAKFLLAIENIHVMIIKNQMHL